jgi:hypothetical protein
LHRIELGDGAEGIHLRRAIVADSDRERARRTEEPRRLTIATTP